MIFPIFSSQEAGMETDDLNSEISKLQMLIKDEDSKFNKYKVRFAAQSTLESECMIHVSFSFSGGKYS
jgi:hypothetical protein